MFRIRKIYDDLSQANRIAISQVIEIMRRQFPLATAEELGSMTLQLHDPMKYKFRTILFVAEDADLRVKGFATLLHFADLNFCYLEFISAAPGKTGGGIGGVLYERIREEAASLGVLGIFFECLPDEPHLCRDPETLKQNIARMRFYERYGVRPILNTDYDKPTDPSHDNLPFMMYDDLGLERPLSRKEARKIIAAILARKYGKICRPVDIKSITNSIKDDPVQLRSLRYTRTKRVSHAMVKSHDAHAIALIVNQKHDIHHVRDRGYVEAPVRISVILKEIKKLNIFKTLKPGSFSERYIRAVHDKEYVNYLRNMCARLEPKKSIYPAVFPVRNSLKPPRDMPMRAGYFCIDTFTPLNKNAYIAARAAVDCVMTGAEALLEDYHCAYALVRPPGHHAERRAFGGFCYFNSAAVAAEYLSKFGKVAILDIDFHHGNGTQDIFYTRSDVLTVSIHGHPSYAYPYFNGFKEERGEGDGLGFNINYPLPETITYERYQRTLKLALKRVREFKPKYLVLCLGLDTAKGDPTGTWDLKAEDFQQNGTLIGAMKLPTLIVQEGGYLTRTLGINARNFLAGVWQSLDGPP